LPRYRDVWELCGFHWEIEVKIGIGENDGQVDPGKSFEVLGIPLNTSYLDDLFT
jgi:hypothetical protein